MTRWMTRTVTALGTAALLVVGAPASEAAQMHIGNFAWVTAPDDTATLAVDTFGPDPWPAALRLLYTYVSYTAPSGNGVAFFDGDFSACQGFTVDIGAGDALQSPGHFTACGGPLPQDITSATLQYSWDASLGTVSVASLGPAKGVGPGSVLVGPPSDQVVPIFFESARQVPEPAAALLLVAGLGLAFRRVRAARRS